MIINIIKNNVTVSSVIYCFAYVAIYWVVLQIRRNGISTWNYLTNNYKSKNIKKKCIQCGLIYFVTISVCPDCGHGSYEETTRIINTGRSSPITAPVYGDTWICKKCYEGNVSTFLCKRCGEPK